MGRNKKSNPHRTTVEADGCKTEEFQNAENEQWLAHIAALRGPTTATVTHNRKDGSVTHTFTILVSEAKQMLGRQNHLRRLPHS